MEGTDVFRPAHQLIIWNNLQTYIPVGSAITEDLLLDASHISNLTGCFSRTFASLNFSKSWKNI